MSQSAYRNLFGEEPRYKYHHMDLCKASTEGNKMAINNKFMALSFVQLLYRCIIYIMGSMFTLPIWKRNIG